MVFVHLAERTVNDMRLIDADALIKEPNGIALIELPQRLNEMPTIDAVPVVHCKDCEFYKPQSKVPRWSGASLFCTRSAVTKFPPDGFCSFGKRKDGGDNG